MMHNLWCSQVYSQTNALPCSHLFFLRFSPCVWYRLQLDRLHYSSFVGLGICKSLKHASKPTISLLRMHFTPTLDIASIRYFPWSAAPYFRIIRTLYFLRRQLFDSNANLFLHWVGALSLFIRTVSSLISQQSKIYSNTWCTKLESLVVLSLKW